MEALKKTMLEAPKVKIEDNKSSWLVVKLVTFGEKKVITLKAKLTKALELKVTFTDSTKFKRSLSVPYKKYKFVVRESNSESHSHHQLNCNYCCKKGYTIAK